MVHPSQREKRALAFQRRPQDLRPVLRREGVVAGELAREADRVGGVVQLLARGRVIRRDSIGERRRGARQIFLLEDFEGPAVAPDERRVRYEERHERREDQRAREENEEAEPPPARLRFQVCGPL